MEKVVLFSLVCGIVAGEKIELSSDGPVVLDAPITFTGRLYGAEEDYEYRWRWFDNASPDHSLQKELYGNVSVQNFTVTYPSSEYDEWTYTMKIIIHKKIFYYWSYVDSASIKFEVSRDLLGKLVVRQNGTQSESMSGHSVVDSVYNTEIAIEFHDPSNFLKKALKIRYWWIIDDINFGQTTEDKFNYTFSAPGDHTVIATVMADFNSSSHHLNPNEHKISHHQLREVGAKMGLFSKSVTSKAPISNVTIQGEKTLKKGQLIDLNLSCDGTGPWGFCWFLVEQGYNITGNETCNSRIHTSNECDFSIMRYYKTADTYNLLVIVSNDVSSHLQVVAVTIYQVAKQMPLFIVIIPVTAAIAAIIILFSGIGVYASFRNNLAVEVADFDFNAAEEEELQYKTFWERLRESFVAAFTSGDDSESEGSSVSGRRSVQIPGGAVGLGYGSIT